MPNSSHCLYQIVWCAVEQAEPLSADMCRFVLVFARHTGDTALAARLVRRVELPADVRAELAADPTAEIRVAYLSRADVPIEEKRKLLATEKRAKILAALVAVADEEMLPVLADHPSRTVQVAVLAAEHAPVEIRRRMVFRLIEGPFTLTYEQQVMIRYFIAQDTEGHSEYALRLPPKWLNGLVTWLVTSPYLSDNALRRLVQVLVVDPAERLRHLPADSGRHQSAVLSRRLTAGSIRQRASLVLEIVRRLKSLYNAPEDVIAALGDAVEAVAVHVPPSDPILREARDRLQNLDERVRSQHLAETSEDPAVLAELVADSTVPEVLTAVAQNRAAAADTTVAALRKFWNKALAPRLAAALWSARSGQDDVLLAVAEHFPELLWYWKPTVADTPFVLRVLRSEQVPIGEKRALVINIQGQDPVPDEVVAAAPLALFEGTLSSALLVSAVQYLTDRVADLPVELLVHIADDFEDSFEALCAVVAGLAVKDAPVAS